MLKKPAKRVRVREKLNLSSPYIHKAGLDGSIRFDTAHGQQELESMYALINALKEFHGFTLEHFQRTTLASRLVAYKEIDGDFYYMALQIPDRLTCERKNEK